MGGFLTIGYCFPYCFLEIFVGGQGLDGGGQSCDGDPPLGETLGKLLAIQLFSTSLYSPDDL